MNENEVYFHLALGANGQINFFSAGGGGGGLIESRITVSQYYHPRKPSLICTCAPRGNRSASMRWRKIRFPNGYIYIYIDFWQWFLDGFFARVRATADENCRRGGFDVNAMRRVYIYLYIKSIIYSYNIYIYYIYEYIKKAIWFL